MSCVEIGQIKVNSSTALISYAKNISKIIQLQSTPASAKRDKEKVPRCYQATAS